MTRRLSTVCFAMLASGGAHVVASSTAADKQPELPAEEFINLLEEVKVLDWQEETPRIVRALDNLWRQNGWNEEADRFAHEVARDAVAIPPWEFMKRINLVTDRVAQRYELSPEQVVQIQGMALREMSMLFVRHAGVISTQAREVLEARVQARPFTSEQVVRWTKEGEPLFIESLEVTEGLFKELGPMLGAKQRKILERDRESFHRRRDYLRKARERWARGEWKPSDWGMQDDPIQRGLERGHKPAPPWAEQDKQTRRLISRWVAHDPSTWFAYALDVKKRFQLDAGQMTTARSIHAELVERANDYIEAHADQLKTVPRGERATHEAYAPICALFAELQNRLEAISTTVQRQQATE